MMRRLTFLLALFPLNELSKTLKSLEKEQNYYRLNLIVKHKGIPVQVTGIKFTFNAITEDDFPEAPPFSIG